MFQNGDLGHKSSVLSLPDLLRNKTKIMMRQCGMMIDEKPPYGS
jgi:hypothetical protein